MYPSKWYIPRRYILVFLGFWGIFSVFAIRVNISVAMIAMVNTTSDLTANRTIKPMECSMLVDYSVPSTSSVTKGEQYFWNSETQGMILGSFYYGYIISQLPGGMLSERYGGKWIFGGGVLVSSVLSLMVPLAASLETSALIAVRVLQGLGEGVVLSAVNIIVCRWSPIMERSRILTIVYMGIPIGSVVSMSVSGWLSSTDLLGGWPSTFYVFGATGCTWFVFWAIFVSEYPSKHPTISKDELSHIQKNNFGNICMNKNFPWKSIWTSVPFWAVIIAQIGYNFGFIILLTELPTYLSGILHFNIKFNGFISALPFIGQAITSYFASIVADRLRQSERISITTIRKIANTIGLCGPAACLLAVTVIGCNPEVTVTLFTLAMAINGFVVSGFNVTYLDMSPDFTGTLFGIGNSIACTSGFIGPLFVGRLLSTGFTLSNWNIVFYITAAVYTVSAVIFAVFASADVQPWGLADSIPNSPSRKMDISTVSKKNQVPNNFDGVVLLTKFSHT